MKRHNDHLLRLHVSRSLHKPALCCGILHIALLLLRPLRLRLMMHIGRLEDSDLLSAAAAHLLWLPAGLPAGPTASSCTDDAYQIRLG